MVKNKNRSAPSHKRDIIIDTNLLLLLIIGSVEEGRFISSSKRLKDFSVGDYDLLLKAIKPFGEGYTTKYIAAEVSNLLDLKGYAQEKAFEISRTIFETFKEIDSNLNDDLHNPYFPQFGLTDSKLIELSSTHLIFTADDRLSPLLWGSGEGNVYSLAMIRALAS
ncbi:hypothetical protein SAMN03159443_05766 [Pseudomonas sp. NFACC15-1]|uniref:hypothetical protein n=1 Tax=unclassified Pseudomonas TaxID=196821 RepID=UPI00088ED662|nr:MULTISPECIES: hypothetical protein [unclassified Pseudomonas]SDA96784.1 hypothetical protein SAMN03159443_05766 [Pseudomonas sp. NFACC15-1]SDX09388.1 hypothetical protein SAMN03159380_01694 [Pseudomonas sp. NFACC14]